MASSHALPSIAAPPDAASQHSGAWRVSPDARAVRTEEHLVLLHARSGTYLSFNATGAIVWSHLERGAAPSEISRDLAERFHIPLERAAADVGRMLEAMERGGLVGPADRMPASSGVPPGMPGNSELAADLARRLFEIPEARRPRAGRRLFLRALAELARVDIEMRTRGLAHLYRRISSRDGAPPAPPESGTIWQLIDAADRAAALYFKQAWCLQRSVACAYTLRRRGVPARLVIGVHPLPFFAHAWVEIDGRAVNERDDALVRMLTVI
ncbi:MAG: lasso peptide biosynthesis B2 protein, partial [Holophagales bacterium]|nr:lasso peptide biosynthesis B2 protein [Holophagales bacterium]